MEDFEITSLIISSEGWRSSYLLVKNVNQHIGEESSNILLTDEDIVLTCGKRSDLRCCDREYAVSLPLKNLKERVTQSLPAEGVSSSDCGYIKLCTTRP